MPVATRDDHENDLRQQALAEAIRQALEDFWMDLGRHLGYPLPARSDRVLEPPDAQS